MKSRLDYRKAAPDAFKAMLDMEMAVHRGSLEKSLIELVKMRASQINRCGYCLDMHSKDARAAGETEQRLFLLSAWREAPFYSARERAALALTEQVTLISQGGVSDDVWAKVASEFSEKEIAELLMAIAAINIWNRLAVATHQDLPEA